MKKIVFILISSLLLSGCWDQNLLKDVQLVYTVGYDVLEDGSEQTTALAPPIDETTQKVNVLRMNSNTVRDSRYHIDSFVSERTDFSKLQVLIVGEALASDQIYPYLDVLYRDPKHHLNARMAMTKETAEELLIKEIDSHKNKSEYYAGLLESSEIINFIPKVTLQQACTILIDPGIDLYLPLLEYRDDIKRVETIGTAIFSKDKYTGEYLDHDQSTLFNILRNKTEKIVRFTKMYSEDKEPEVSNFMTLEFKGTKTELTLEKDPFALNVHMKLKATVTEYGPDHLVGTSKLNHIESWWEKSLQQDTEKLFSKLKNNQSDLLGIGRMTAALMPEKWDEDNWHETYKNLPVKVNVEVTLSGTGIID